MIEKKLAVNSVQDWNSFDILKLLCAFLVVGIHTQPFDGMGIIDFGFSFVTRFAVPVFFLLSGFFLFKKNVITKKVLRYCTRILTMYAVWCVVYYLIGVENPVNIKSILGGGGTRPYGICRVC